MTDHFTIEERAEINAVMRLKPLARQSVSQLPEGVHTITDPEIIRAAWGPRRVSSRNRGMDLDAYPKSVTAAKGLLLDWINNPVSQIRVVIAKKKAQARIDAALGFNALSDAEMHEPEPIAKISQEEIDDMMQERVELRTARKFAEADKIRDYLVRHGVNVQDKKVV